MICSRRPSWQDLLNALEASEGRRQRRKRDTTPDAIGLGIKRRLLEEAIHVSPVGVNPGPDGILTALESMKGDSHS
jgi:hypothetical protein